MRNLIETCSTKLVGIRPFPSGLRAVKRRPKNHPLLNAPSLYRLPKVLSFSRTEILTTEGRTQSQSYETFKHPNQGLCVLRALRGKRFPTPSP
jgi:hypothetical protein